MCWKCKKNIQDSDIIYHTSTCDFCGTDLHSCKNCKFYSVGSHYDCHESEVEFVSDKEKANFCDFFKPNIGEFQNITKDDQSKQKARDAFAALFGD